jgi:hypothetical protein
LYCETDTLRPFGQMATQGVAYMHLIFECLKVTIASHLHSLFHVLSADQRVTLNCFIQLKYGCSSSEDHQFVRGIPIYAISQVLKKIISDTQGPFRLINGVKRPMPFIRLLEVELYPTLLSKARSYGLSDNWVQVIRTIF